MILYKLLFLCINYRIFTQVTGKNETILLLLLLLTVFNTTKKQITTTKN